MKSIHGIVLVLIRIGCSASFAMGAEKEPQVSLVACPAGEAILAKTDANGAIHLAYSVNKVPHYAKSIDGGKSWSRGIGIVDRGSQKPGLEFDVWDMAIGKGGSVHVALGTNAWKLKLPENEWGYFYASLGPS